MTPGEYAIKPSVLRVCLRDDVERDTFQIKLVDK